MAAVAAWPPTGSTSASIIVLLGGARKESKKPTPQISTRWLESLEELALLRKTLIKVDATGSYSGAAYVKARGFVVLAHGVIEGYLEGIALEVVDGAIKRFMSDDKARTALLALLLYGHDGPVPDTFSGGPWGVRAALKTSRQRLRDWTEANNGIKEKDVLRLLLPTGLKESDMGSVWLAAMSELGELRGRVAHKGVPPGASHPVDPKDAVDSVEKVLTTLCRLDARLVALRDE